VSRWNETYDALAACYDAMTEDVDYPALADFLEKLFARGKQPVRTILDLACGTGTMSCLLTQRGYELIGVDFSPDMLAVAAEKAADTEGVPPIFLCQSMEDLDLYGTVDACVCLLDSVNHVTSPKRLQKALHRVWLFLEPGGQFIFDVHTPEHLASLDGGMFLDETDDAYCVWRTDYQPKRRICTYAMDVFLREGDAWLREGEVHEEYAYTPQELEDYLTQAGFLDIRQYGNRKLRKPAAGEERIFFTARKPALKK
jgi:SAM-dependent methyltransferase